MARCLVLEDYAPVARAIVRVLSRAGHEVTHATHVMAALEASGVFDFAIVDIDLPDGSGVDAVEELLNEGKLRQVVFYTATSDASLLSRAHSYGPVVHKREGLEVLVEALEGWRRRPSAPHNERVTLPAPADLPHSSFTAHSEAKGPFSVCDDPLAYAESRFSSESPGEVPASVRAVIGGQPLRREASISGTRRIKK